IALNNATLGVINADFTSSTSATLTVSGTNTIYLGDTQDPNVIQTSRNIQIDGTLLGSGVINVVQTAGITNADGNQGFRIRGTGRSNFNGTINVGNTAKFEFRTIQAGPFSPAGTAKIVLAGGDTQLSNGVLGTYSEFNLRNNSGGNTVFGNDVEISG